MNRTDYLPPINPSAIAHALPAYHSVSIITVEPSVLVYKAIKYDNSLLHNQSINQSVCQIVSQDQSFTSYNTPTKNPANKQPNNQSNNQSAQTASANQSTIQPTPSSPSTKQSVLIKLIARFDPFKCCWLGPTHGQVQALFQIFDTVKSANIGHVPNFVRPVEIKQISIVGSNLATPVCNQSVNPSITGSFEQCAAINDSQPPANNSISPSIDPSGSNSSDTKFRSWVLITHEPIGSSLAELSLLPRYQYGIPLSEVLPISLQLCAVLAVLHQGPLQRRGLDTRSICYDPCTCRIQLSDHGLPSLESLENIEGPACRAADRDPSLSNGDDSCSEETKDELSSCVTPSHSSTTNSPQNDASSPLPHSAVMQLFVHGRWNFLGLCFMSPEQTGRIYQCVDSRSDIYSLGVIMYVLLTGKLPFAWSSTSDPLELVHSIITSPVPSVRAHIQHVPNSMASVVAKCMNKQPNERYQSIDGLEDDLFRVYHQMVQFAQNSACILPVPLVVTSISPSHWTRRLRGSRSDDVVQSPMSSFQSIGLGSLSNTSSPSHVSSPSTQIDHLDTLHSSDGSLSPPSSDSSNSVGFQNQRFESESFRLSSSPKSVVTMPTDQELGLNEATSSLPVFSVFPLGREDAPTGLFFSNHLYGREKYHLEMNQAIAGLILHGGRHLVVVRGTSGSGKSALIRSVLTDVRSKFRNVQVLSSKIDMYNRNPLTMWNPIVNEALINIFQQPSAIVAEWKARIVKAVGINGGIATRLFPVLTHLIGQQPPVPELPPSQAQQRVMTTLTSFLIEVCVGAKRSLIMFFDDVQWADENSLSLLENLATQSIVSHVCFILAYRCEAVNEQHPVIHTISRLRTSLIPVTDVECTPLTLSDLQVFVQDCTHTSAEKALPIAIHLFSRSQGNPFFARQLLIQMHHDHQLVYRVARKHARDDVDEVFGEWGLASAASLAKTVRAQADMEDESMISHNESDVIKLVQSLVARLKPHVTHLLSLAAFLGSSFTVRDLAIVSEDDISSVTHAMTEAVGEELIELSLNDVANLVADTETASMTSWSSSSTQSSPHHDMRTAEMSTFTFVHDRVQQACFDLIKDGDRPKTHLCMASLMLAEARKSEHYMQSHLFHIVRHVINSLSLLQVQSAEAREWAAFLLDAAKKGDDIGGYANALEYVNTAAVLVGIDVLLSGSCDHIDSSPASEPVFKSSPASFEDREQEWRNNYASTRDLSFLRCKLLHQNQQFDIAISESTDALAHMSDVLDRYEFYVGLQEVYTAISHPEDAFRVNRTALAELGFHIPYRQKELSTEQLLEAEKYEVTMENLSHLPYSQQLVSMLLAEFDRKLENRSISSLINKLPPCIDHRHVAIVSLLSSIIPNCYVSACEFTLPICLLSTMHMLDHGIAGPHAHGCSMLGIQLLSFPEMIRSGRPFALTDLAVSIINRYPHAWSEPKTKLCHAICQLWYRPFTECDRWYMEARRSAIVNGVQSFVSYSVVFQSGLHAWSLSLTDLKAELERFRMLNQRASNDLMSSLRLETYERSWAMLEDPAFDVDDTDATLSDADQAFIDRTSSVSYICTFAYCASRARVFYIMNQPRGAVEILAGARLERTPGNADNIDMIVLRILSNAMLIRRLGLSDTFQASAETKIACCWTTINSDMQMLEAWNKSSPSTFGCMYALACAEIGFAQLVCEANERFPRSSQADTDNESPDERCLIEAHYRAAVLGFSFHSPVTNLGQCDDQSRHRLDFLREAEQPSNVCMWFVAVAYERFTEFSLFHNQPESAMGLLVSSYNAWQQYGCRNKIRQLSRIYSSQFGKFLSDLHMPDTIDLGPLAVLPLSVNRGLSTAPTYTDVETFVVPEVNISPEDDDDQPPNDAYCSQLEASRDDYPELAMQRWWEDMMEYVDTPRSSLSSGSPEADSTLRFADFDLRTVINASQAISREIVLPKLLSIIMTNVLRVSGSEKVVFFSLNSSPSQSLSISFPHDTAPPSCSDLPSCDTWQVDSYLNVLESRSVYVRPSLTSMNHHDERSFDDQYPQSIMNFVVHSQHQVILSDASVDLMFSRDPYIQSHKVKSLLCLPLMHRGGMTSVLYLENSTSAGLFRSERLLVCKLIAAQVTISIDNARLYERITQYSRTMEMQVAQRTKALEKARCEAQEASKAKSMFLSTMSHEIRTPMNGVIGGCELLASDSGNLTAEQLEVLGIIRTGAEGMLTIINDILDLSKIEAGRCEIMNTSFQVRECVENILDVVASTAHSKGLEIQYFCDLDVPFLSHTDHKCLTRCLFNLLSNAIKFTMKGEVILTISMDFGEPLSARVQSTDKNESSFILRFSVRDTGLGIPPEFQQQLFRPVTQTYNEMPCADSGGGLGLVICKHLVEMMGGQVGMESEAGVGSNFWFTIKCMGSDEGRPCWLQNSVDICESLTKSEVINDRPKCLLIHQFEVTRNCLVRVAAHWGVDVITVSDVASARSLLVSVPQVDYAVVIMDYRSISRVEQVDVDTDETVAMSQVRDEANVYIRYNLEYSILEDLGPAINQHTENYGSHVTVVGLGPIGMMSTLRSIFQHQSPRCHVMYVSTPIKIATLYRAMHKAVQEWIKIKICTTTPTLEPRAISDEGQTSSSDAKINDAHSATDIECIMVVEDNPVNRKVLIRMLDRAGYQPEQIMIAENGAIAVDMLHSWLKTHQQSVNQPDMETAGPLLSPHHSSTMQTNNQTGHSRRSRTRVCMLLDLLMPVMGGIEACQRIRASPNIPLHQQPYIIALTANAGPDDREKCLEAKMDSYLAKPATLIELTKALKDAARGRQQQ